MQTASPFYHQSSSSAQFANGTVTSQAMAPTAAAVSSTEAARALEQVRNSDSEVPAEAQQTVERAIQQLWQRLQANPNYLMNKDEFALFNYARSRYTAGNDAVVAQRAVARYWDSHTNQDGAS